MSTAAENPYIQRYKSQPIHDDLRYSAERIVGANLEGLDFTQQYRHARVGRAIAYLRAILDSVDPELINPAVIDGVNGAANSLRAHIDVYVASSNAAALEQAEVIINELFIHLRLPRHVPANNAIDAANSAVRDLTKSIFNALNQANARNASLNDMVVAQEQRLAQQHREIDAANQTIESQKARLDQAITNYQTVFSQSEADRTRLFTEQSATWERMRQEQAQVEATNRASRDMELSRKVNTMLDSFGEQGKARLDSMQTIEAETRRIFNVVGEIAQSGEYRNAANREARAANILRTLALSLMVLMAGAAGTVFVYSLALHEIDWKLFSFRLATAAVLAIPAFYAAQESAKHREREQSNRRLHLELAAIDAYLALLPDDKKNEIKASLTEKFFGREERAVASDTKSTHLLIEALSKTMENLTKPR